jgi:hypothetical protein
MGVYYIAVCDEKQEYLEPFDIKECPVKAGCMVSPFARLLCFKLLCQEWPTARIEGDSDLTESYLNVTREAIEEFNDYWKEQPELHIIYEPLHLR